MDLNHSPSVLPLIRLMFLFCIFISSFIWTSPFPLGFPWAASTFRNYFARDLPWRSQYAYTISNPLFINIQEVLWLEIWVFLSHSLSCCIMPKHLAVLSCMLQWNLIHLVLLGYYPASIHGDLISISFNIWLFHFLNSSSDDVSTRNTIWVLLRSACEFLPTYLSNISMSTDYGFCLLCIYFNTHLLKLTVLFCKFFSILKSLRISGGLLQTSPDPECRASKFLAGDSDHCDKEVGWMQSPDPCSDYCWGLYVHLASQVYFCGALFFLYLHQRPTFRFCLVFFLKLKRASLFFIFSCKWLGMSCFFSFSKIKLMIVDLLWFSYV